MAEALRKGSETMASGAPISSPHIQNRLNASGDQILAEPGIERARITQFDRVLRRDFRQVGLRRRWPQPARFGNRLKCYAMTRHSRGKRRFAQPEHLVTALLQRYSRAEKAAPIGVAV